MGQDPSVAAPPRRTQGIPARFERQVDPERLLPPDERAVLVDTAIRAYNARMTHQRLKRRAAADKEE